jgi:hypothetical protein
MKPNIWIENKYASCVDRGNNFMSSLNEEQSFIILNQAIFKSDGSWNPPCDKEQNNHIRSIFN